MTERREVGSDEHGSYVPALGFHSLTRFYDPLLRLTLRENEFKQRLITQANIQPGHHVLDVGCGTGTLLLMLKSNCPKARISGIDGDSEVLAIARKKIEAAGGDIELRQGLAYELPFGDASFDRGLSSLVFHHLITADKTRSFEEIRRVLRPGGELHIADFGRPQNWLMSISSSIVRLFDGSGTTSANLEGRVPALMSEAGFVDAEERGRMMTPFGTLSFYRGVRR